MSLESFSCFPLLALLFVFDGSELRVVNGGGIFEGFEAVHHGGESRERRALFLLDGRKIRDGRSRSELGKYAGWQKVRHSRF